MNFISSIFFFLAALVHVLFFVLESFLFQRDNGYKYFKMDEKDHQAVKVWAFNQGYYNLFLALGLFVGLYFDNPVLKLFCGLSMIAAGVVLIVSARHLLRGALLQAVPPFIAVVLLFLPQV